MSFPSPEHREESFDLKGFVSQYLLRYWYLYVLSLGIALLSAWLRVRYATPIHQIRATLLIEDEQSKSGFVSEESIFRDLGLLQGGPRVLNEIQVLQSRPLMTEVVRKLGLDTEYYIVGRVRTSENYPSSVLKVGLGEPTNKGFNVPFEFNILDKQHFKLQVRDKTIESEFGKLIELPEGRFLFTLLGEPQPENSYRIVFRRPEALASRYVSGLNVNLINNYSSVVEMTFKSPVPRKAADILNTLVEVYNESTIERKNQVGNSTIRFIDDRLKFLTAELSDVEGELESYKRSNNIPTEISSSVDLMLDQLNESDSDRTKLEIQKTILGSLQDYLSNDLNADQPTPVRLLPDDPQLATLCDRYNQLVLERERLLLNATKDFPVVKNLDKQVDLLRKTILSTIQKQMGDLEKELVKAQNAYNQFLKQLGAVPSKERGLIEIKRQQGIKESLFLYLLQKREETALALAVATPGSRVVDPAEPNKNPISPKKRNIYLLALLFGLIIPSGIVYLRTALQTTIQNQSELETLVNIPLLGSILFSKSTNPAVVVENSRSAIAEQFRLLRTNLEFLNAGRDNQVILFTSGISGEGKSFITLNTGLTMALSGKKTVLLELDLRRPKLVEHLGKTQAKGKGISSYLIGQARVEALPQPSELHPNLFVIPSGPLPPNPGELLLENEIETLIAYLREHFDCILLDTPPIGMVADALLLGRVADSTLYILRHQHSPRNSLSLLKTVYEDNKLPHLAVVYNGVRKARGYYGNAYYGYGQSAGYYYEAKPAPWWKRLFSRK